MQPLSRVKSNAMTEWGLPNVMELQPKLAISIAQCIAKWSEIEIFLGAFLAFLLHANEKAAFAMYSGLENRSAQLRLISAAAEATLPSDHFDSISVLLSAIIRPAMRERDKLAHWTWGHSKDLPDALLLAEPGPTLASLLEAQKMPPSIRPAAVSSDFNDIYVVRESDLARIDKRLTAAKEYLRMAMATVWSHNKPDARAEFLQQLSNEPPIREGLSRLAEARKKTQEAQRPSPQQERND